MRLRKKAESDIQMEFEKVQRQMEFLKTILEEAQSVYDLIDETYGKIKNITNKELPNVKGIERDFNGLMEAKNTIYDIYFDSKDSNQYERVQVAYDRLKKEFDRLQKELVTYKDQKTVEFWTSKANNLKNKMKKIILADNNQLTIEDAQVEVIFQDIDNDLDELINRLTLLSESTSESSNYDLYFDSFLIKNIYTAIDKLNNAKKAWHYIKDYHRDSLAQKITKERYE